MRTETEMLDLIIGTAKEDERIRAAFMNGSRANPNVPHDIFQDYDIVYAVTELASFLADDQWTKRFGETIIRQEPDNSAIYPTIFSRDRRYSYLMQFDDGNRIDLTLITKTDARASFLTSRQAVALLDKDGLLPDPPAPERGAFRTAKPGGAEFRACCNEFWWGSIYVAKGLWRRELLYAMDQLNQYVRSMLMTVLDWYAGMLHDFRVSMGKCNKYMQKYLPPDIWERLVRTYPSGDYEAVWAALFEMATLFRITATAVASQLSLPYDIWEDRKTYEYLERIHDLPPDAQEIVPSK